LRKNVEKGAKNWVENIEQLHSICRSLTPKTDAARVETLIAMVQIASDDITKYNDSCLSALHVLENTNSIIKASLAEFDEEVRRIDLELEKAIKEFNEISSV
jgi:hypothetical protein